MNCELVEPFTTKKAARNAGMIAAAAMSAYQAPKRDAEPMIVKGEPFYWPEQCEDLVSRTAARSRGLTIRKTVPYYDVISSRVGGYGGKRVTFEVFRISDAIPKTPRRERPPKTVDLMLAVFVVNKSAKRYRDAASKCYAKGSHSFAAMYREKKERLYELKDRGICEAIRQNRLRCEGAHGGLAIYRGEGYCFHSTIGPAGTLIPIDSPFLFVEATEKPPREPRLTDAMYTLAELSELLPDGFTRLVNAPKMRSVRHHPSHHSPKWSDAEDEDDEDRDDFDEPENY